MHDPTGRAAPENPSSPDAALNVLYVDDDDDIRAVVEIALGIDSNMTTACVSSGQAALDAVAEFRPDIILLDVMMPVMDGPTTLALLRTREPADATPVVFVTARTQEREVERFLALGAAGVIAKPFDPMTLAAQVRAFLTPAG
ncbi:response regulator [Methylopila musalis]|uniref:Response regulator n=1 Tax=Methylopila musalis TaxID=1134781 RepID=A0ABW3Z3B4_9HYPH